MYRFKIWHEAVGEYELKHAPEGWDAIESHIERVKGLHGVRVDFTLDLKFVKDGFDRISTIYETFGIQANVLIFVYEASRLGFHYNLVYTGTLAYEKWVVTDFPRSGTANIDFIGFTHKFLNSEDTEVNLHSTTGVHGKPMTGLKTVDIEMHSQAIHQGFDGAKEVSSSAITFMVQDDSFSPATQLFTFGFDKVESNELGVYEAGDGWLNEVSDAPILDSKGSGSFTLKININGEVWASHASEDDRNLKGDFKGMEVKILFRKNDEEPIELFQEKNSNVIGNHTIYYNVKRDVTVDLEIGDKIYLQGWLQITERTSPFPGLWHFKAEHTFSKGSSLKIGASTTTESSIAQGVLVHEAFDRICESITGYPKSFYSEFFGRTDSHGFQYKEDGPASLMAILNGFALRGFPQDYDPAEADPEKLKRYLHTSFKELFEAMDAIYCLGVGIEKVEGVDVVRVEPREYFYNTSQVAVQLGKVSKLKKSVASDFYYKEVLAGYSDWKIEDVNGLNEFNASQTWTTPVTRTKNRYEAICSYIASGYRIEKVRRQRYSISDTTDTGDDSKIFVVMLTRDGYGFRSATNEGVSEISGVDDPASVYNLRICPANMVKNHLRELSSSFYKVTTGLVFNKGEGNYKMSYTTTEGVVTRNGVDIPREEIGDAYFIPEHYEFEAPLRQFDMKTIRENPYAMIKFMDSSGAILAGHLLELKHSAKDQLGEFKLLRVI